MRVFNLNNGKEYTCKYDWPENCRVQANERGVVFTEKTRNTYLTAFFEAFPKEPKTFIRGEGSSVEEAEKNAWEQLQGYLNCPGHEFEKRGYTNGCGFCIHCNLFQSNVFEISTRCIYCDKPTNYINDLKNNYYCEEHLDIIPDEDIERLFGSFTGDSIASERRFNIKTLDNINARVKNDSIASVMKDFMLEIASKENKTPNILQELDTINLEDYNIKFGYFYFNMDATLNLTGHKYIDCIKRTFNNEDIYIFLFNIRERVEEDDKYVYKGTKDTLYFFCDNEEFALNIINKKQKIKRA